MIELNNDFLEQIGLGGMPEEHKAEFLQHIHAELERRVGPRLAEGMSDAQLAEFEGIIDNNRQVIDAFFAQHVPNYQQEQRFQDLIAQTGSTPDDTKVLGAYAALRWLDVNRPNYQETVKEALDEIVAEILQNKDRLV